jgi:hypothetical protein
MKRLFLVIATTASIFGFNIEIKSSDVTLKVNDVIKEYKKGDRFYLKKW